MILNSFLCSNFIALSAISLSLSACNQLPADSAANPAQTQNQTTDGSAETTTGTSSSSTPAPSRSATPFPSSSPAATATPRASSTPRPTATPAPTATPTANTGSYPSCVSSDSSKICLGLKIVSYVSNNVPVISEVDAINLVNGINQVWAQCNIAFQLEVYQAVDPTTLDMPYSPDWQNDTTAVRQKFGDKTRMVVEAVGPWNVATIAVTIMPGSGPYGTVVDQQYSHNPLTVGHELGHYQGLYHVNDNSDLMSPYIGSDTKALTSSQCSTSRSTDQQYWVPMMRVPQ